MNQRITWVQIFQPTYVRTIRHIKFWSTGHGYNYKARDIKYFGPPKQINIQHYWFLWCRENVFTRVEATLYYAIR